MQGGGETLLIFSASTALKSRVNVALLVIYLLFLNQCLLRGLCKQKKEGVLRGQADLGHIPGQLIPPN